MEDAYDDEGEDESEDAYMESESEESQGPDTPGSYGWDTRWAGWSYMHEAEAWVWFQYYDQTWWSWHPSLGWKDWRRQRM